MSEATDAAGKIDLNPVACFAEAERLERIITQQLRTRIYVLATELAAEKAKVAKLAAMVQERDKAVAEVKASLAEKDAAFADLEAKLHAALAAAGVPEPPLEN